MSSWVGEATTAAGAQCNEKSSNEQQQLFQAGQIQSDPRAESAALWLKKSIERFISAMCKLVVMILILLTLLCNYLMIVFYKCLWVFFARFFIRLALCLFSFTIPNAFEEGPNQSKKKSLVPLSIDRMRRVDRLLSWDENSESDKSKWREREAKCRIKGDPIVSRLLSLRRLLDGVEGNFGRFAKDSKVPFWCLDDDRVLAMYQSFHRWSTSSSSDDLDLDYLSSSHDDTDEFIVK